LGKVFDVIFAGLYDALNVSVLFHVQFCLRFWCNVVFTCLLILYHKLSYVAASSFPLFKINFFYYKCWKMDVSGVVFLRSKQYYGKLKLLGALLSINFHSDFLTFRTDGI
jgi:hypothetical protein